jgi:hypothetical protein
MRNALSKMLTGQGRFLAVLGTALVFAQRSHIFVHDLATDANHIDQFMSIL